jgi:hypothetical protein
VIDFLVVLSPLIVFLLGLFCFMTFGLLLFPLGVFLSMEKLSHSSFDRDQTQEV